MLAVPAPFPHPGARAYLKGTGEAREVIQQNADGTATVKVLPKAHMTSAEWLAWANRGASRTQRVPANDLCPTLKEALAAKPKRRRNP
jgi:hypothetical protein